ncbi:hypothetical protein [Methylobacterium fujisawaense]|uniref:hypothetical protein n=1 Tax=Methylobacterium fujisawaense TaxID=107400 RepID=UPI00313CAAEF
MLYSMIAAAAVTSGLYAFRVWDRRRAATNRTLVLEAVKALAPYGYGVSIKEWVEENAGRSISLGGIYCALEDLEDEGLIGSAEGPRRPERGNRRVVYFLPR